MLPRVEDLPSNPAIIIVDVLSMVATLVSFLGDRVPAIFGGAPAANQFKPNLSRLAVGSVAAFCMGAATLLLIAGQFSGTPAASPSASSGHISRTELGAPSNTIDPASVQPTSLSFSLALLGNGEAIAPGQTLAGKDRRLRRVDLALDYDGAAARNTLFKVDWLLDGETYSSTTLTADEVRGRFLTTYDNAIVPGTYRANVSPVGDQVNTQSQTFVVSP